MPDLQQTVLDAEINQILDTLGGHPERLPKKALYQAKEHWDRFQPKLIEAMRNAAAVWKNGENPGDIAFFGLFLCVELADRETLPVIIEIISLPGEGPFDLLGDGVHEVLPQALATLAADQIDLLDGLFADPEINIYVRWAIGKTFAMLVRDGRLSHEEAVSRLHRHLENVLKEPLPVVAADEEREFGDDAFWPTVIVDSLFTLLPHAAADDMLAASDGGRIDESFIDRESVCERIEEGPEGLCQAFDELAPSRFEDTVAELSTWGGYQEAEQRRQPPPNRERDVGTDRDGGSWDTGSVSAATTIIREQPKVSRNDPCPCGSGKKFKKCCGSN